MKTPPFSEHREWTQARYFAFLRSALRASWSRWPPKYKVLASAKRKSKSSNKRLLYEYQCAKCKEWFPQKEVSVDHIQPAGKLNSFSDLPAFCERLHVGVDKLQVLCTECHRLKTKEDRASATGLIETAVKTKRKKK